MQRNFAISLLSIGALAAMLVWGGWAVEEATAQSAEAASASIWDGVYSGPQAERGRPIYEATCGACHGLDLSGGRGAQPLKGDFLRYWYGYPLGSLFTRIKYTMPSGAPASLSDEAYVDIVAYILKSSDFPAGNDELSLDELESIRIEGEEGPQPIPNYAFVRVIGCLAAASESEWTLSNASEPVRTRDAKPSRDQERRDSMAKALGSREFSLRSIYPDPSPAAAHRVEVKGFWIQGVDEHINVNALQTLDSSCG